MVGDQDFPHPIFVGGSARSGTHMLGQLVGADPRYHAIEAEARFHCGRGGLPDLLSGGTDLDSFCERMLGGWWIRGWGQHTGLQRIVSRAALETAVAEFRDRFPGAPREACRGLVASVMVPARRRAGSPAGSTFRARTCAAHPPWRACFRGSHSGLRQLPPERALTVFLDDLAALDRQSTLERLVDFLEVGDPAPIRRHFNEHISAERAHVGAWRERIAPADARWLDRHYRRVVRRLRREGIELIHSPSV